MINECQKKFGHGLSMNEFQKKIGHRLPRNTDFQKNNCSDRILTCRIKSIRSPAKVGLVVTDLITSPVVSWEGWETPPPQHRGSAVILCSTIGVVRPLCSCGDLLLSSARHCLRLVDV